MSASFAMRQPCAASADSPAAEPLPDAGSGSAASGTDYERAAEYAAGEYAPDECPASYEEIRG